MDRTTQQRSWPVAPIVWLSIGLFDASRTVIAMRSEGMNHAWPQLFVVLLMAWLVWIPVTSPILRLSRRHPLFAGRPTRRAVAVHVAACLAFLVTSAALLTALDMALNPWLLDPPPADFLDCWQHKISESLLPYGLLYGAILGMAELLDSRRRAAAIEIERARLDEQLARARLAALRSQIEPHFLFNSLNAIAALVREARGADAVAMIARVGDLLRRAIDGAERQEVALGDEIEMLGHYLEIQKLRFGERLDVALDVPPGLASAPVPSLILQPMVENAIKHGIARRAQGGAIRVSAEAEGAVLTLSVYNDGPPVDPAARDGIGLANTRARLERLYGAGFALSLRDAPPDGVTARLTVPLRGV
jgi:hypothetical protein